MNFPYTPSPLPFKSSDHSNPWGKVTAKPSIPEWPHASVLTPNPFQISPFTTHSTQPKPIMERDPSKPQYTPMAAPISFVQTCQNALREVKATSSLPQHTAYVPQNGKPCKIYSSSSMWESGPAPTPPPPPPPPSAPAAEPAALQAPNTSTRPAGAYGHRHLGLQQQQNKSPHGTGFTPAPIHQSSHRHHSHQQQQTPFSMRQRWMDPMENEHAWDPISKNEHSEGQSPSHVEQWCAWNHIEETGNAWHQEEDCKNIWQPISINPFSDIKYGQQQQQQRQQRQQLQQRQQQQQQQGQRQQPKRRTRLENSPTEKTFFWKHPFPKGWYPMLKRYLLDDLSKFARYQMHVVNEDWSNMNVKGTSEQLQALEHSLYLFVCLHSRSDLYILYQTRQPSSSSRLGHDQTDLVQWMEWPHPITQDLDCSVGPFYSLVQCNPAATDPKCLWEAQSSSSSLSCEAWPEQPIRSRQTADVFTQDTFQYLLQQFHLYHAYFTKSFSAHRQFRWKWSGSLGKQVVSVNHLLQPNRPGRAFALAEMCARYRRGSLRGSFAFNVWHDQATWRRVLTQTLGYMCDAAHAETHHVVVDLPATHVPDASYVRATFQLRTGHPPTLKSVKTKATVPVKLTLSLTDLVYDMRLRLVFRPRSLPVDLSDAAEKATYLLHHGLDAFHGHYGRHTHIKIWSVHTQRFKHPSRPIYAKVAKWHSNVASHPPYFTLKCNYHPTTQAPTEQEALTFLEELHKIAFAIPSKPFSQS